MFKQKNPPGKNTEKTISAFFVNLVLVLLAFILSVYLGIFLNNKKTIDLELKSRAHSIVETIVLARSWSALHGGVYVEKTPEMISSPFLENPDVESRDGTVYTKKNPALMLREISEIAEQEGSFVFHMSSNKPLNPVNVPDEFENLALMRFEQGDKEAFLKESKDGATFFRYMAPLIVQESCLDCHAQQGYQVGDVRGGISVRFNIDAVEVAQKKNFFVIVGLALASFFTLAIIIYRLVSRMRRRLLEAEAKLQKMAVTDALTGLKNRRYLMDRLHSELKQMRRVAKPLSCILFDLDHFKRINDTFGHATGDRVLQAVAATAREQCRENDILGRFGGEEFMILLPGTSIEGARGTADRLRNAISDCQVALPDGKVLPNFTASFGVSWIQELKQEPGEEETALFKRADDALYRAKENGRNRVESTD